MAHADDQGLALPARIRSMASCNARAASTAWSAVQTDTVWPGRAEALGDAELQLRTGGVDQVVEAQPLLTPRRGRAGVDDVDRAPGVVGVPSGRIATAFACTEADALRLYTGASGKTTSFLSIFPTPTQMLHGIQFHCEFGDTTVTVCPFRAGG